MNGTEGYGVLCTIQGKKCSNLDFNYKGVELTEVQELLVHTFMKALLWFIIY